MSIIRLAIERVEKLWGRRDLGADFEPVPLDNMPVGELRFVMDGSDPALLVKYLFTSEKLSVQVHPDNARARAAGEPRGKSEAWLVVDAVPGATIGVGLKGPIDRDALRTAALDGSLEDLIDWRPVAAGDFFYLPAGTIHALGAGVTVIEIQQNSDTTYRLFDYGRPRDLHVDEGVAAAILESYCPPPPIRRSADGRTILVDGPSFTVERRNGAQRFVISPSVEQPHWLVPVAGEMRIQTTLLEPGGAWLIDEQVTIDMASNADVLIAYSC